MLSWNLNQTPSWEWSQKLFARLLKLWYLHLPSQSRCSLKAKLSSKAMMPSSRNHKMRKIQRKKHKVWSKKTPLPSLKHSHRTLLLMMTLNQRSLKYRLHLLRLAFRTTPRRLRNPKMLILGLSYPISNSLCKARVIGLQSRKRRGTKVHLQSMATRHPLLVLLKKWRSEAPLRGQVTSRTRRRRVKVRRKSRGRRITNKSNSMRQDSTSRGVTLPMLRSRVFWYRELRRVMVATIIMQRLQLNRIRARSNSLQNRLLRRPVRIRAVRGSKALTKPSRASYHKHSRW